MKLDVSFIVLNWHNESETAECIKSIKNLEGRFKKQIIVVDNETSKTSYNMLKAIQGIDIVRNKQNLGFAGGVNSGLKHVRGNLLALVNNDCVLGENWLKEGVQILQNYDGKAIVGGKEYAWSMGQDAFIKTKNFYAWPSISPKTGYSMRNNTEMPEGLVSNITGSNMLTKSKIVQDLQGFDEDFFAYYEDADFCARALAKGYSLVYSPHIAIWHKRNVSSNKLPYLKFYLAYRNHYIFVAKNFPSYRWAYVVLKSALSNIYSGSLGFRRTMSGVQSNERRKAYIHAGFWGLCHWRYLYRKRKQCIARGENDPDYLKNLNVLQA